MTESLTIVVSGMVAATPDQGGATWAVLQYLLGFRALGHDVWLVEPVDEDQLDRSPTAGRCDALLQPFGLADRWCLVGRDGSTAGLDRGRLRDVARKADVLINISGMLTDRDVLETIDTRVYLDLDPGFVQLWHTAEHIDMRLDGHTHFVTVADSVGRTIPDCGRTWIPTLPPVVLDEWPVADEIEIDALTTVANWRGYGSVEHDGVHYGQKVHSLRGLFELPERVKERVGLALQIHPDERSDLDALRRHGWELLDPAAVAGTPNDYRRFVQGSWAELGIAKSGYVVCDSGWFSDRSACYLASGRPVIGQDTGFGRRLPTGTGLLSFRDVDDAAVAVEDVRARYDDHRAAARAIAEDCLDARRVLTSLLENVAA